MAVTEEQLKQLMDDYGNTRYLLEDLKSAKETALQTILSKYPEIAQEVSDMEEELIPKIEEAEKIEKRKKKILQTYLDDFGKTLVLKNKTELKSNLIRVGFERKVKYDPAGLDGMAMENPKLLPFRSEEISTRITLNSK